jgi:hypothetical protein
MNNFNVIAMYFLKNGLDYLKILILKRIKGMFI